MRNQLLIFLLLVAGTLFGQPGRVIGVGGGVSESAISSIISDSLAEFYKGVIYAKSDASGKNTGNNWNDAYTDLQEALDSMKTGYVLFTDAPFNKPFGSDYSTNGIDSFFISTNQGPSGRTVLTNARKSSWTKTASGRFQVDLATSPTNVFFDFRQDDITGSITGVDLTRPTWKENAEKFGRPINQLAPWYGMLVENTVTPTDPQYGEWGYSAGTLYVNVRDVTVNEANRLLEYTLEAANGLTIFNATNAVVSGDLIGYLFPDIDGNQGYILKGQNVDFTTFEGVTGIYSGYHVAGMAGSSGAGNRLINIFSSSGAIPNPYVFYTSLNGLSDAGHVGQKLGAIYYPFLDINGKVIDVATSYGSSVGYSHTDADGSLLGGITWDQLFLWDATQDVSGPNGEKIPLSGVSGSQGLAIAANTPPVLDSTVFSNYPITLTNSYCVGPACSPKVNMAHRNVVFDRTGYGSNTSSDVVIFSTAGGDFDLYLENCVIRTGDYLRGYFASIANGDYLYLKNNEIEVQSTDASGKAGVFSIVSFDDTLVTIIDNVIYQSQTVDNSTGGINSLFKHGAVGGTSAPILFVESINNTLYIEGSIQHSNNGVAIRDTAWWEANVETTSNWRPELDAPRTGSNYSLFKLLASSNDAGGKRIMNVGDPESDNDVVPRYYVEGKFSKAIVSLDFPSTAAGATSDLTLSLTGAAIGESVAIGVPNVSVPAGGVFFAWVSAANTVTVRYFNTTAGPVDPDAGVYTATVIR